MSADRDSTERIDFRAVGFLLASVRVGVAVSLMVALGVEAYLLATWDDPHRVLLSVLSAVAVLSVLGIGLLPRERIMRSRWAQPFLVGWSGSMVVVVAIATAADGGAESPLSALFVLPLIFAALAYEPPSVLVVAVLDLVAFAAVALAEPVGTPESVFVGFVLLCAAVMSWWQSRNWAVHEGELGAIAGALEDSESLNRKRALQQHAVAAFGQRALAGAPVEGLMRDAVWALKRVLDVDIAGVLEIREGSEDLLLTAGAGIPEELLGTATVPGGRGSQSGYTLERDRPVVVADWSKETRFTKSELVTRVGASSGATVVIKVGGRAFGILGTQSAEPRRLGNDDIDFLQAMANVLASAIERRNEAEDAHHRALHDPLTGLPNRALFEDRLTRALAEQERRGSSVAVIFLDIDDFKLVNDSLGHHAGDELLREIAPRLTHALRPGDTVARFGGDEFGVLLEDVSNERDATRVAERIAAALAKPFVVGGREHFATASAGIALGGAADVASTLIRDSDAAMYRAKERGRARYEIFDEMMRIRVAHRLTIENELRSAIDRDELRVHYQPVVSLRSGEITGVEALVRWEHPRDGLMQPEEFMPVAEESGFVPAIGRWVLEQACRQAAAWHEADGDRAPVGVSVNASVRELGERARLRETVKRTLAVTGLDPATLSLELTEGALIEEAQSAYLALSELKELGIRLALDDFGTGYSSLASLRRLPFDSIKLDRSFVGRLGQDRVDHAIVRAVVTLAHTLELDAVAEGVETEEQLAIVKAVGCDQAQGFYFGPPVVAEELGEMLRAREPLVRKPA